jgi:NAD(P)-dependent dehydrogenase (short-subunit alcohol dehydrogenase family)
MVFFLSPLRVQFSALQSTWEEVMELRLRDKVAIVTGAGQGIGAAIAKTLAAAGARVTVNDINPDRAERIAAEIRADGGETIAVTADVSNKFQCVHLIETTRAEWGQLDILVNNAGVEPVVPILKMDEWDWNRCIDVNLKGTFLMSQLCGRVMADENKERGGAIVNLSSVAGLTGYAGLGAYCSSKGAVRLLTKAAAVEAGHLDYGIRVNSIHPAVIRTAMGEDVIKGFARLGLAESEADADALIQTLQPLGYGEPSDVANAVLYLASGASRWITGAELSVDGGATAGR